MPLALVTGPANAAKAGVVFAAVRAALDREPLLVVPTAADVDHYRRELAGDGLVFGVEVMGFDRLLAELARRAGVRERPLGAVARERVLAAAVGDARLTALAAAAATPGFAAAAGRLMSDLRGARVSPGRLSAALRSWSAAGRGRAAFADDVARLYRAYTGRLERLGRPDRDTHAWAVLDALAADPALWAARPVAFYGWDDFTRLQLAAVDVLARVCDAEVTASLAYEPGRAAFAGRAAAFEELRPLTALPGGRHVALPERAEHYADGARAALHHLERHIFEAAPAQRPDPGAAVRLLEAGGERPEAELVAAEVLALIAGGIAAEDIAVITRAARRSGPLLAEVLGEYGIPAVHARCHRLEATPLAGAVLAAARAALPHGTAADVLRWLRVPGDPGARAAADALERRVRRAEAETAAQALRLAAPAPAGAAAGSAALDPLAVVAALAAAAAAGPLALLEALAAAAVEALEAPRRRTAAVLDADEQADAAAVAALRGAIGELTALGETDPGTLGSAADVVRALGRVEVTDPAPASGGVLVADPLAIRARRFRAVVVCGLQDGEFPAQPVPDPFFDDERRRELGEASGLRLPRRPEELEAERYLLYAAVSRPTDVLVLSYRTSDEEGDPAVPSPFVADVAELFAPALVARRRRRLLADVAWPAAEAPTAHELRRALAATGPRAAERALAPPAGADVLAQLAANTRFAARELEAAWGCGVRWLVEAQLRPARLDADPEPMRRGSLAHAVLHDTFVRLGEATGSRRLTAESLPAAERALDAALEEHARRRPLAAGTARAQAARRRLEIDLRRLLRHAAAHPCDGEPSHLEWSFGGDDDAAGVLELAPGIGVRGRVDRIDTDGSRAVVVDYKSSAAPPVARWEAETTLQVPLYALAVRELLGLEPVAGLYQPLSRSLAARGVVRDDAPLPAEAVTANDVRDAAAFDAVLEDARRAAIAAAEAIRGGELRPCPATCAPNGCAYPGICRAEAGA